MTNETIAELVVVACSQVAKQFGQFDSTGNDISGEVFRKVSRAVEVGREKHLDRENASFVIGVARKQARREFVCLLKARRMDYAPRIDVAWQVPETFALPDATSAEDRRLDRQGNPLEIASRDELTGLLRAWIETQNEDDRVLIRTTDDLSLSEAAKILEVDKSTVSRRRDRLFARARIELAELAT